MSHGTAENEQRLRAKLSLYRELYKRDQARIAELEAALRELHYGQPGSTERHLTLADSRAIIDAVLKS